MPELNAAFTQKSNVAFNNILFSDARISGMPQHPSLKRLYEAAKSLTPPIAGKSAVAAWLNVSPQMVNNWEKRGVSRAGALAAQTKTGYSATWILDGLGDPRATATPEKGAFLKTPTAQERELVQHWGHLLEKDREKFLAQIAELAKEREAERQEIWAEAGLDRIQERAAHAARRKLASTAVEPGNKLKQRSLLDEGGSS